MKSCIIALTMAIFLSSCLKESIPEAMLNKKNRTRVTATFSYKINGNPVSLTVEDVDNQVTVPYYMLGCTKNSGNYMLSASVNTGSTMLYFRTDSLAPGNYKNTTATIGENWVLDYLNRAEFLHAPTDSMSINITSHINGHINGNFSGVLTPLLDGNIPYTFGTSSSVSITEGAFSNVPVYY